MADSIWPWSLSRARDAAASEAATPGGGSIACVSGCFGLALVSMALEITYKKAPTDPLQGALGESRRLLDAISAHADRDIAVFEGYMAALSMAKTSDAERASRSEAIQRAVVAATQVPLAAARDCLAALRVATEVHALVQHNVLSDVLAGGDLLRGAVHAVLRNVDINLPALRDIELKSKLATEASELAARADALHASLVLTPATR